jgi:5-aminolevulinate synthase
MLVYNDIFSSHIDTIAHEGRYREFLNLERSRQKVTHAKSCNNGNEVALWCSNDYLGMSSNHKVVEAAMKSLGKHGLGSGGTRNISGNNNAIVALERAIAELHEKERALVFTSGYVANDAALGALAKIMPNLVFFSDELNHASIIAGISNSKCEKHIYNHLDSAHLENLLRQVDIARPKIIVFESAYSMDGLFSPIEEICALAKKYNALTYIDEVHTVGLYGRCGAGLAESQNLAGKIDMIQGTLSKAYGAMGGYIAASNKIIDAIRLTAHGFIFTTSIPPLIASASLASIEHLKESDVERTLHKEVVTKVKSALNNANIHYLKNDSHIIPIIIGDPIKAKEASRILLEKYNIYIQHINFPTVPRGSERLRITPTPHHTDLMITELVQALVSTFRELEIDSNIQAA